MYQRRRFSKKTLLVVALLVAVATAAIGTYLHFHNRNPANLINNKKTSTVSGTVSQPNKHKTPETTSVTGQSGGVVDKSGQTSGTVPPSTQWVSSNSGRITLQQPSAGSVVRSGDLLTGLAQINNVHFILIDNSVGLISQGNLTVVNGKFSGALQFISHSNSGKLEVYYPNPTNGAEEDIVEINVSFST